MLGTMIFLAARLYAWLANWRALLEQGGETQEAAARPQQHSAPA